MESLIEKTEGLQVEEEDEVDAEIAPTTVVAAETDANLEAEVPKLDAEKVSLVSESPLEDPQKPVKPAEEVKRQTKEFYACIEDDPYLKQHEHDLNNRLQKYKK